MRCSRGAPRLSPSPRRFARLPPRAFRGRMARLHDAASAGPNPPPSGSARRGSGPLASIGQARPPALTPPWVLPGHRVVAGILHRGVCQQSEVFRLSIDRGRQPLRSGYSTLGGGNRARLYPSAPSPTCVLFTYCCTALGVSWALMGGQALADVARRSVGLADTRSAAEMPESVNP